MVGHFTGLHLLILDRGPASLAIRGCDIIQNMKMFVGNHNDIHFYMSPIIPLLTPLDTRF